MREHGRDPDLQLPCLAGNSGISPTVASPPQGAASGGRKRRKRSRLSHAAAGPAGRALRVSRRLGGDACADSEAGLVLVATLQAVISSVSVSARCAKGCRWHSPSRIVRRASGRFSSNQWPWNRWGDAVSVPYQSVRAAQRYAHGRGHTRAEPQPAMPGARVSTAVALLMLSRRHHLEAHLCLQGPDSAHLLVVEATGQTSLVWTRVDYAARPAASLSRRSPWWRSAN